MPRPRIRITFLVLLFATALLEFARADFPNPILGAIFPPGGQVGTTVEVTISGEALDDPTALYFSDGGITARRREGQENQFAVIISPETPTGWYDVHVLCRHGLSSPRAFFVGNRAERSEAEPNDVLENAMDVPLDVVVNGRVEKNGDVDHYRFTATRGQRVVIDCLAEGLDSRLLAVLEVQGPDGKRLVADDRSSGRIDPVIDLDVPADGSYVVSVADLTFTGGPEHFYRLAIDTGPRVAYAVPAVVEAGKTTRVALHGQNLAGGSVIEIDIAPPVAGDRNESCVPPIFLRPSQTTVDGFAYRHPGGHAPILIGVTDLVVAVDGDGNHSAETAREIAIPGEVSGQLIAGEEQDWFAITARRGEVLWLDALGERLGSPVDLEISVLDADGNELARFTDELRNPGGLRFPSAHADPQGRLVAPADGRYLVVVRNVIGGLHDDPRRVYRLRVRREESDFHLAVISRRTGEPAALNVPRGGRAMAEVIAFRERGARGSIRVSARGLPPGIECPEIWLHPGVDRAPLVIEAHRDASPYAGAIDIVGETRQGGTVITRRARGGTMVRSGLANGVGRLTSAITFAVTEKTALRIGASANATRFSQGSVVDVGVVVDREDGDGAHDVAVKLTGVLLPGPIRNQIATIPAGVKQGNISFYIPPELAVGRYTIAIRGDTTVTVPDGTVAAGKTKTVSLPLFSSPITFDVYAAPFIVAVDLDAPRQIRRGQVVKVRYTARRRNGFIGKIHTEIEAPGGVVGIRGRGVTFISQADSGILQIVATEDAPLGQQPFLRLDAIGTVEDEPVYRGGCFFFLEIIE